MFNLFDLFGINDFLFDEGCDGHKPAPICNGVNDVTVFAFFLQFSHQNLAHVIFFL